LDATVTEIEKEIEKWYVSCELLCIMNFSDDGL